MPKQWAQSSQLLSLKRGMNYSLTVFGFVFITKRGGGVLKNRTSFPLFSTFLESELINETTKHKVNKHNRTQNNYKRNSKTYHNAH